MQDKIVVYVKTDLTCSRFEVLTVVLLEDSGLLVCVTGLVVPGV